MEKYVEQAQQLIIIYGAKIIGALAILIIGIWASKIVSRYIFNLLSKRNVDLTLTKFVSSFIKVVLIVFVIIASISKIGVETTSFIAVLAAAGFAVGLALQGSLSNFAAGIMLILFRPIRVGDYIEASSSKGNVEQIGIFTTLVEGENEKIYIIPNSKLMSDVIVNHSYKKG
ncbi:MAG: mechanosensitive ion channel domain-containing protein [bacterium]